MTNFRAWVMFPYLEAQNQWLIRMSSITLQLANTPSDKVYSNIEHPFLSNPKSLSKFLEISSGNAASIHVYAHQTTI